MTVTVEKHPAPRKAQTKKQQIKNLYLAGEHDLQKISDATDSRLSYVASVLQREGLIDGYYDLYNDGAHPMNAYSDLFRGRLGYKDEATALNSVRLLHEGYLEFEALGDRAAQHHVLMLALQMYDRARWSGKTNEAQVFKRWLVKALEH